MAILSFDGRVQIAIKIVTESYPEARLYEADGTALGGPTTNPDDVNQLRVVFQNSNNTTVIIKETSYGEFGDPVLIHEPWLEDIVIDWPVPMDLPRANELKEQAGHDAAYTKVTLRNPLGPQKTNPFFIFNNESGGPYIFVDVVTGKVHAGE